jgi:transposase
MPLGRVQHGSKNAYSLGLRRKFVKAKVRGMSTIEVIRNFRVGHSCVKRYAKTAREGSSLRQRRNPGSRPKADERARWLLKRLG